MRIGVTGGAGFIGAKLVRHLVDEPVGDVVVIDGLSTGDAANLSGVDATLHVGTILDGALLDRVVDGADAIVQLEGLLGTQLIREHRPRRPGDVRHPQADGSPLSALLPDVARLRDGLAETMEWLRTLVLYPDG